MQILVVDDSDLMRGVVIKQLLALGFRQEQIQEAQSGVEAIRKLHGQQFDLLLLDIVMEGVDGVSVLKEVKSSQPEAKVIMCSTFSDKDTVKELIDLGIDDFVVKPFKPEKFQEVVLRHIVKKS